MHFPNRFTNISNRVMMILRCRIKRVPLSGLGMIRMSSKRCMRKLSCVICPHFSYLGPRLVVSDRFCHVYALDLNSRFVSERSQGGALPPCVSTLCCSLSSLSGGREALASLSLSLGKRTRYSRYTMGSPCFIDLTGVIFTDPKWRLGYANWTHVMHHGSPVQRASCVCT